MGSDGSEPNAWAPRPVSSDRARSVHTGRPHAGVPWAPTIALNRAAVGSARAFSTSGGTERLSPSESWTTVLQSAARAPRVLRQARASAPSPSAVRSTRSEERRVGKECRCRWERYDGERKRAKRHGGRCGGHWEWSAEQMV